MAGSKDIWPGGFSETEEVPGASGVLRIERQRHGVGLAREELKTRADRIDRQSM